MFDSRHDAAEPGRVTGYSSEEASREETYDGELAAVFLLRLDSQGHVISANHGVPDDALLPNRAAFDAAMESGSDLRTIDTNGGASVRLLTYRLPAGTAEVALQLGRVLDDQTLILRTLLSDMLLIGAGVAIVSLLGSWWLSGRLLVPERRAWQRQQTFVANASHELRTPLTLIRLSAQLAQQGLITRFESPRLCGYNRAHLAQEEIDKQHHEMPITRPGRDAHPGGLRGAPSRRTAGGTDRASCCADGSAGRAGRTEGLAGHNQGARRDPRQHRRELCATELLRRGHQDLDRV
jgi:signal transduction histidine kinase